MKILKNPKNCISLFQHTFILAAFLLLANLKTSAQNDSLYESGKLFVKIKNTSAVVFPNFVTGGTIHPDLINYQTLYGITKISRPFVQFSNPNNDRTYLFEFSQTALVDAFMQQLPLDLSYIDYAEKVSVLYIDHTPNDLMFGSSQNAYNWHLKRVGAESAWNVNTAGWNPAAGTASNTAPIVAVIDNEIQMNHPDLQNQLWNNPLEFNGLPNVDDDGNGIIDDINGRDFADGDNNTSCPNSFLDHGTHVAGLVGARTNNSTGIASLAYNCRIMPLKIANNIQTNPNSLSIIAAINAIYYANAEGANIINLSWGTNATGNTTSNGANQTLATACSTAVANNVLVVAAAGNDGSSICRWPASNPGVIKVLSTTPQDVRSPFSNFNLVAGGTCANPITVCAPGSDIYSTNNTFVSSANVGYDFKSGTSMASPIVASLCALMKNVNPLITNTQLQTCLTSTAVNINAINSTLPAGSMGSGRINAPAALQCAASPNVFFSASTYNTCAGKNITFTGYSTIPFANISNWNWTFSQTPTIVSQVGNQITVNFATNGLINVSLAITQISPANTFPVTQNNCITIASPSATAVKHASGTLCNNSLQQCEIIFQNVLPPLTYSVINCTNAIVNMATNNFHQDFLYYARSTKPNLQIVNISDANGCGTSTVINIPLNIQNCCDNIIPNGNFELGNQLFTTENIMFCPSNPINTHDEGGADVRDISTNSTLQIAGYIPCGGNVGTIPMPNYIRNELKNILEVNGRMIAPAGSVTTPAPITGQTANFDWFHPGLESQLVASHAFAVVAGNYNLDIFITYSPPQSYSPIYTATNRFRMRVIDGSNNIIFNSGVLQIVGNDRMKQLSFEWNNTFNGNIRVELYQVDYFNGNAYDFSIDEFTLRRTSAVPTLTTTFAPSCPLTSTSSVTITPTTNAATPQYSLNGVAATPNFIVTPGTHTIRLTNVAGCAVTNVVNILPEPAISITNNFLTNCSRTLVVNSTNGQVLTTYRLNLNPTQTSNTFTININGTYTITATNSNGCIATSTITITNAGPSLLLNVPANCFTGSTTITAVSTGTAVPVTFNINGGSQQTSNLFNISTAGIYTVQVTSGASSCTRTSTISLTANPTVSISATTPPCTGPTNPATLTATTNGTSLSWSNGATTVNTQVFSAGIYTVTATNAAGCTSTSIFNITSGVLNPCNGQTLSPTMVSTINTNAAGYFISGNTTINNSIAFNSVDIGVKPGSTITVLSPFTLTISRSHLRGCNGMWQGIIVNPGAKLIIQNNSLIEDAIIAVDIKNNTNTANILTIDSTIFNKNETSIKISNCVAATTAATFVIRNAVFTSRLLPLTCVAGFNWPTLTSLKATGIPNPNVDLNSPFLLAGTTTAPLLNGLSMPKQHIELINVGNTSGAAPYTFNSVRIGEPATAFKFNLLDRARFGIKATNSNFECFNNVLQNILISSEDGYAIYAENSPSLSNAFVTKRYKMAASFTTTSIVNKFFNNTVGIYARDYTTHDIQRCDMRSMQTSASVTASGNNNLVGTKGISITSNVLDNTLIQNNSIFNHYNGIQYYSILGSPSNTSFGNATISNNTINRINATAVPTAFVASAINASMGIGTGASVPTFKTVGINSNVLNGVYEGINISNFNLANIITTATSNDITLAADPNVVALGASHSGIRFSNMSSNITNSINSNTVRGIANTNTAANSRVVNYEFTGNSNTSILCNRSVTGYTGFKFSGNINPNTFWRNSIMDDATSSHWWGYHLNDARIGPQGFISPAACHDNRFGNFNGAAGSGHTMVTLTIPGNNASLSPLFVRSSTLPFMPTSNQGNVGVPYSLTNGLIQLSNPPAIQACNPIPPAPVAPSGTPTSGNIQMMIDVALGQVNYGNNGSLQQWLDKYNLFKNLTVDVASRNASPTLLNFYNNTVSSNIKNLVAIEDLLTQGNTIAANALLQSISPINVPEQNYKAFYLAYSNYLNGTLQPSNLETISTLALGCPSQDGLVVFNARTMHNMLNPNQFKMYANNCPGTSNKISPEAATNSDLVSSFVVYPNPTDGGFRVRSNKVLNQLITVELFDITGKKVFAENCTFSGEDCQFYANVVNGIYLIKIINTTTNETSLHKIHFNK